jgi:hypothetical protein
MAKRKTYYQVAPRYTAGSPAQVDRKTAERVAVEERASYQHYLDGVYGAEEAERARTLGLGGIAESYAEVKGNMHVHDLITDKRWLRRFTGALVRCMVCGTEVTGIKVATRYLPEHHDEPSGHLSCVGGKVSRQLEIRD